MVRELIAVSGLPLFEIQREHAWQTDSGGWKSAEPMVLVCPKCLRAWAHLDLGEGILWPRAAYCEDCAVADPWHPVPGSILTEEGYGSIDTPLLDALPETLLCREFRLHMRELDRREK